MLIVLAAAPTFLPSAKAASGTFSENGLPKDTSWCVGVGYSLKIYHTGINYCTTGSSVLVPTSFYACLTDHRSGDTICGTWTISGYGFQSSVTGSDGKIYDCDKGCSGNGSSGTAHYALAPFDFALSNSGGITVTQGSSGSNTITATLLGGATQSVTLACTGTLPTGVTCSFNPSSGQPTFNSQLTVSTTSSTPTNSYTITLTGTSGSGTNTITHTTTFTLTVSVPGPFDFGLTSSGAITANQGNSGYNQISVSLVSGNPQMVSLTCTAGLPAGATCSFNPSSANPPFTSTLTLSTSSSTPTGSYSINVTGAGGGITRTTTFALDVTYSESFSETGLPTGTSWCVVVGSSSGCSSSSTQYLTGLFGNVSYMYNSGVTGSDGKTYDCNSGCTGTVTSLGAVSASYQLRTYAVTFSESGLPSNTVWCVTVDSMPSACTNSTSEVVAGLYGSLAYSYSSSVTGSDGKVYSCNGGCTGTVAGATTVSASYTTTTTVPSAPTNLAATPGTSQVTLTWNTPTSNGGSAITNYKIYRGTSPGSESLLETIGNVLTYTDTALTNGQTNYYEVSAVNGVEEGPLSNEASATPTASQVTVTFNDSPASSVTITCGTQTFSNGQSSQFPLNSMITCTANAAANQQFTGWSGLASGATNPVTFNVGSGGSLTASFTRVQTTAAPLTPSMILLTALLGSISLAVFTRKRR